MPQGEFSHARSLRELLQSGFRFSFEQIKIFAHQVSSALQEAHSLGIIHRDLKPENIVVSTNPDESMSFRVLDFGLTKRSGVENQS